MTALDAFLAVALVVAVACLVMAVRTMRAARGQLRYESEMRGQLEADATKLGKIATNWERRFWSLHHAVDKLLGERDGWKHTYNESVNKHLNGQAVLEQGLTKSRAAAVALAKVVNEERERRKRVLDLVSSKDRKPSLAAIKAIVEEAPTKPLHDGNIEELGAYPRGAVESYFNNIIRWNEQAKKSQEQLKEQLAADREHWEEHFEALVPDAPAAEPSPAPLPPSESLEGMTVQELREL